MALCTLFLIGGGNFVSAGTDVTASYIGDLDAAAGKNGDPYGHAESNGIGWWNSQTTGLTGWHAFTKNGTPFESWTGSFGGAGVMIGRTMVLPEGNYTLSFEAFGANATNSAEPSAIPVAGDVVAFMTGKDNVDITNTTVGGNTFHNVSFTFDVTTANTAFEFGIKKLTDDSKIDWCQIRNVSLVLNSTDIFPVANNNISPFVYSGSQTWHTNTWSVEGQSDGSRFQVPFHELWVAKGGKLADATITGTYTPTKDGVYKVSAWVRAVNESGGAVSGVKIFVGDAEADACTGSSVMSGKGRLGTYTAMADGVNGTPFNYGFKIKDAAVNWLAFKNVTITYLGALPQSEIDALLDQVPTGKMNVSVKSTLDGYVSALNTEKSVASYNALSLYLPTAQASATIYDNINTAISTYAGKAAVLDAAGQAAYDASGVQTKYNNGTYETLAEAETELQAALVVATRQQTSDNADWTAVIVNPSFETGDFTGWTNSGMAVQGNNSFAKVGTYYAESWQPNGTKSVSQTIADLPAGVYSVTAKAYARTVTSAKLFAGTSETAVSLGAEADIYSVNCTLLEDGDLILGFEGVGTGADASWLCLDNFTLKFLHAPTIADSKVVLNEAITTATGARKTANEGTGVFQIPAAAGTALAGAITNAQNVYDNGGATISDVTTAISTLNTAVETYEAITLNAPDAEKRYNVILTNNGEWTHDGKAITYIANDRKDMGLYNIKYQAAPNANLAQAFTLTQVSGNTYTMSQTDAEGNTRYLCTGVPYSGGNASQIRTTTTAGDALVVKIIATETANVFNIYNTEADNYIGSQDAGVFTVNSHINFTIAEASQAEVDMTISEDVKYATRIFPFTPSLPTGVVAYSCESADGDVLNLGDPVATPAANTPYILYAENGYTGAALTGWGTAAATTATAGLLTGVYVETPAPVGSYVLQNNNSKVGFYVVAEGKQPTVGANRCYLTDGNTARSAFFFGGNITGVDNVEAASEATLKDGKYLENGKIVIVKNGVKYNAAGAKLY